MESDHDDPNLSQEIHGVLSKLMENETPSDIKADMTGLNSFLSIVAMPSRVVFRLSRKGIGSSIPGAPRA